MMAQTPTPGTYYEYKDRECGDVQGLVVATTPQVFYPTSTTVLLLRAIRQNIKDPPQTALDLGCGCGIVAVALAKLMAGETSVYASDLSENAVALARRNAAAHNLNITCKRGSLFEPWQGMQFDLIADDVAGVAEPIARMSKWYPPDIPSEAGRDGTRWILEVLAQAPDHLSPRGKLLFPVLTLSDENKILARARERFASVRMLAEQWYPLDKDMVAQFEIFETLASEGNITIEKRGSRWWWATKIFQATNAA